MPALLEKSYDKSYHDHTFRGLGVFILILLGVFLALGFLGAGSSKRTQKPLRAHQGRFQSQ
jgi:hypothetical protein